jgi:hypothetical protein
MVKCFITGLEYILAKKQKCEFLLKSVFYNYPKYNLNKVTNEMTLMKQFSAIIKNLQSMRRQYPKGMVNNMLYKELGTGYKVTL